MKETIKKCTTLARGARSGSFDIKDKVPDYTKVTANDIYLKLTQAMYVTCNTTTARWIYPKVSYSNGVIYLSNFGEVLDSKYDIGIWFSVYVYN